MMPHPERASAQGGSASGRCETLLGGEDGLYIWRSILEEAKIRG